MTVFTPLATRLLNPFLSLITAFRGHRPFQLVALALLTIGTFQTSMAADNKVIKIGISTSFPPFNFLDSEGNITGYNADVAMAVCRKMAAKCEFTPMPFPKIIGALEDNRIQLAASNLLWTSDRARRINFSAKYYRSTTSLVGKHNNSDQNPAAIIGNKEMTIAVTEGSTQWRYLTQHARSRILAKASIKEALAAAQSGEADYLLLPTLFALNFLEKPENFDMDFVGLPIEDKTLSGDVHLGITKAEPKLKRQVDDAIQQLVDSGELRALINKYFPFNVY